MKNRTASLSRETRETNISMEIDLDSFAAPEVETTLPFLDHMLEAFAVHGSFALKVKASGDTEVDPHHLVEDSGVVLGSLVMKALGHFKGIRRAGFFLFPMDRSLARVALDLCGRPNLVWNVNTGTEFLGTMNPALLEDFFKGLVDGLRCTLHASVEYSDNDHHALEAVFKAFGRALAEAVRPVEGGRTVSSKGAIDD